MFWGSTEMYDAADGCDDDDDVNSKMVEERQQKA